MVFAPPWMKTMTGRGVLPVFAGGEHVERQAVLAARLVLPGREQQPLLVLDRRVAEPGRVAFSGPRRDRLGSRQTQCSDRAAGRREFRARHEVFPPGGRAGCRRPWSQVCRTPCRDYTYFGSASAASLQQSKPDFTDRRIRGHRMPESFQWYGADDRDCRRMHQLGYFGPGEGSAEDHVGGLVDHQLRAPPSSRRAAAKIPRRRVRSPRLRRRSRRRELSSRCVPPRRSRVR